MTFFALHLTQYPSFAAIVVNLSGRALVSANIIGTETILRNPLVQKSEIRHKPRLYSLNDLHNEIRVFRKNLGINVVSNIVCLRIKRWFCAIHAH